MSTLVVDAYDSFVHIINQYLSMLGADPVVARLDELSVESVEAMAPRAIVLGPGPGHPAESGHVELLHRFVGRCPILGVCLGHQAVALVYGADVHPADHLMHGKASPVRHDGRGVFTGLPNPFEATRYHSLVVDPATLPDQLQITARSDDDGYVMGLRDARLGVETVQFHPESVGTDHGMRLLANFLQLGPAGQGVA